MQQKWQDEMNRRAAAYKASPEGVAAERHRKEVQRRCDESAKGGVVSFDVVDEAAWAKWKESNEDSGYGEACLRYAARWASIMDVKLLKGAKLEEIVDATSHEADTEGITGFMHGCAVSMLAGCWRHGEALKRLC